MDLAAPLILGMRMRRSNENWMKNRKKYKDGNDDERVLRLFLWEDYEKENIPGNEIVDGFVLFCWKSEWIMIFL